MKTDSIIKLTIISAIILALFVSCSAVFDAGVSGYIYYYDGTTKTYVSDAKVSVYSDSNGTNLMASTTTDANGAYTVRRIVWESSNPAFGKTADYTTIYIKVTHDDFEDSALIPVTIISDSTNDSQGSVELTRIRFPMPVFSGRVTSTTSTDYIESEYDDLPVYLCYKDETGYKRFAASSAKVYTTSAQVASYDSSTTFSHGNFSNLGGSTIKWEATPDENNYASMTVYLIFDHGGDLTEDSEGCFVLDSQDLIAEVVIQSGTQSYQVSYNSFKSGT